MKKIFLPLLLSACWLFAQQPQPAAPSSGTRVVTTTRLVMVFTQLESQLMTAVQQNDQAGFDRLLDKNFQEWTPQPPGQPVPRADWIQRVTAAAGQSFDLRQMAVVPAGNDRLVSFVLNEQVGGKPRDYFIVDLWTPDGPNWRLSNRYRAQVSGLKYPREAKPTGKQ